MKKVLLSVLVLASISTFTSCKKSNTCQCECTYSRNGLMAMQIVSTSGDLSI